MIALDLARRLRDAGLGWQPARGDRFVVPDKGMDEDVFVISDMVVEVQNTPTGEILGFNGITEWALDSCLLYTSPSPRDQRGSRMPSSA